MTSPLKSAPDNRNPSAEETDQHHSSATNMPHFDSFISLLREQLSEAHDFDANDLAKAIMSIHRSAVLYPTIYYSLRN